MYGDLDQQLEVKRRRLFKLRRLPAKKGGDVYGELALRKD